MNLPRMLIFLEFVDEAELFLGRYLKGIKALPKEFTIVSFHPLVKSYLLKHSISTVDSFHFCPAASHQKLLVQLEEYTEVIRRKCRLIDSRGVKESYTENLLFSFRCILSHWLYRVEVIANAIEYYNPEVVVSVGSEKICIAQSLWVEQSERYIPDIVRQVCSEKKVVFKTITLKIRYKTQNRSFLSKWLKNIFKNLIAAISAYSREFKKNLIIVPSTGHNMVSMLKDLSRELPKKYEIAVLDLPFGVAWRHAIEKFLNRKDAPYDYLPCNTEHKVSFSRDFIAQKGIFQKDLYEIIDTWRYRNVSLAGWLRLKYQQALEQKVINATYYQSVNLDRFLDKWQPVFVVSQYARGITAVIGELCQLKQIPSLMIPHGSFTAIPDEYSKREWKENALGIVDTQYQYLALQTPLIKDFLLDVPVKSEPIITGPLIFGRKNKPGCAIERLKQQFAPNGEILIFHASTPKHRKCQRLFNYETIDEYVDGLVSLVEVINNLKGVRLIIRYRVIDGLSAEELKNLLPESNSYAIASDGDFLDYLSIADVLVSFSSSTMEEALQNNIPVLLFNKYNRYQHITGVELTPELSALKPAAVYNVNSENNLLFAIQWILENHLPRRNTLNFLFDKYRYRSTDIIKLSEFIQRLETKGLLYAKR